MKINFTCSGILIGLLSCMSQSSIASSLNIDFGSSYPGILDTFGAASGQTGYWNPITAIGPTINLIDTSHNTSGVDLSLTATSSDGNTGTGASGDLEKLLNDNFLSYLDSWSLTLSGLQQGDYDIYYYAPANTRVPTGSFTINGLNVASLSGSPAATLVQGVSWDVLSSVTIDSTGNLDIQSANNGDYHGLSGLQIVPVTTIPVPAAIWLFGSGLLAVFGLARSKYRQ